MDPISKAILKELLPGEGPVEPPRAHTRRDQVGSVLDHLSSPVVLERAAYLRKLAAAGDGSASEVIKEYPQHAIHLLYRSRDGMAEQHENFADIFFVLQGRAALLTGGAIQDATTVAPGEVRGSAVAGGSRQELRAGDMAHVPAGLPHQMIVSGDGSVVCIVLKIEQNLANGAK
jgi:mannose-6-phosphate isomerase-like protein (cupin superfamily)